MSSTERTGSTRVAELEKTCSKYATEVARLEFKVGEMQAEINRLHAELNRRRGTRQTAHELYRAVDDAIIARIDRRGFNRKQKVRNSPALNHTAADKKDKAALMVIARDYDAQAYFTLKSAKTGMKLQYRVASKAYRIVRDTGVFALKKTYRLAKNVVK